MNKCTSCSWGRGGLLWSINRILAVQDLGLRYAEVCWYFFKNILPWKITVRFLAVNWPCIFGLTWYHRKVKHQECTKQKTEPRTLNLVTRQELTQGSILLGPSINVSHEACLSALTLCITKKYVTWRSFCLMNWGESTLRCQRKQCLLLRASRECYLWFAPISKGVTIWKCCKPEIHI